MAIKFYCQCGKRLKARDESAGRRTQCPQCGEPVGIPSLTPTHRGVSAAAASMPRSLRNASTRTEANSNVRSVANQNGDRRPVRPAVLAHRSRSRSQVTDTAASTAHDDRTEAANVQIRERSQPRWTRLCGPRSRLAIARQHSTSEPALCVVALTVATIVSACVAIRLLPTAIQEGWTTLPHGPFFIGSLLALLVSAGYGCSWAARLLRFAVGGKTPDFAFSPKLERPVSSLVGWLGCFLAGPVVPAVAFLVYWVQCGSIQPIDWLILTELAVVAVGYWFALLISVTTTGGIRSMLPTRAIAVFRQLGLVGVVATLLTVALLFSLAALVAFSAAQIHRDEFTGFLLLGLCCIGTPLLLVLILNRLGSEYHRSAARQIEAQPTAMPAGAVPTV